MCLITECLGCLTCIRERFTKSYKNYPKIVKRFNSAIDTWHRIFRNVIEYLHLFIYFPTFFMDLTVVIRTLNFVSVFRDFQNVHIPTHFETQTDRMDWWSKIPLTCRVFVGCRAVAKSRRRKQTRKHDWIWWEESSWAGLFDYLTCVILTCV